MIETNMINHDEIAKLDQIDQDCRDLHVIPPPRVYVELEVKDADDNVIQKHTERAKSWVRNFYNYLMIAMAGLNANVGGTTFGAGTVALKKTDGSIAGSAAIVYPEGYIQLYPYNAGIGTDAFGIVVGTGSASESFDAYALASKLTHGISSGSISYQAASAATLAYDSLTKKYAATLSRVFNNNTAALISVAETGLIGEFRSNGAIVRSMLERNVLSTAVDVPVGGQLTVKYVITLTYPE